ncbi:MAG: hypothetical protein M1486_06015, partial [Gammaproteobacteria bacterium]|nr:hypothetical protein [Gammaproteobacteria bacterium]
MITPDGLWFSKAWLKILREDDPATGVFQREQELIAIQQEIESLLNQQQQTEQVIANRLATIKSVERERDQLQPLLSSQQKQVAELQAQLKMKQARLLELQKESERF